jgi:hypothetical protein
VMDNLSTHLGGAYPIPFHSAPAAAA